MSVAAGLDPTAMQTNSCWDPERRLTPLFRMDTLWAWSAKEKGKRIILLIVYVTEIFTIVMKMIRTKCFLLFVVENTL